MSTQFRFSISAFSILSLAALSLGSLACSGDHHDDGYYYAPSYHTQAVAVANVAGDGMLAAVSVNTVHGEGVPHPGFVAVRLQDPAKPGYFLDPIESDTESDPVAMALADLTGAGGKTDLIIANRQVIADPGSNGIVTVQKQDAAHVGKFLAPTTLSLGARNPSDVAAGDLNHDGLPDIAVAADGAESVLVFFQNSDGTFTSQTAPVGGVPNAVAIADLDHDGYLDLVVATSGNTVSVLIQDAAHPGNFLPSVDYSTGTNPVSVKVAALTDPNFPDILTANYGTSTAPTTQGLSVLAHDPAHAGQFLAAETYDTGDYLSSSVAVGVTSQEGVAPYPPYIVVANQGAPGWPGSLSVFALDTVNAGSLLAPALYDGAYGPSSVALGNLGGYAVIAADGGTFLRFEATGHPGTFGNLIQLRQ